MSLCTQLAKKQHALSFSLDRIGNTKKKINGISKFSIDKNERTKRI